MSLCSLSNLLTARSGRSPSTVVAFGPDGSCDHEALLGRVAATADALHKVGVRRALLLADDTFDFAVGLFALLHAGAEAVLAPHLRPGTAAKFADGCDGIVTTHDGDHGLPRFPIAEAGEPRALDPIPSEARIRILTSGSGGKPKPILKSPRQFELEAEALDALWGAAVAEAPVQSMVPHQHMYGLTFTVLWPLMSARPFDRRTFAFWEDVVAQLLPGSFLVTGPAHLERIAGIAPLPPDRRPSFLLSAGAPLRQSAADEGAFILGRHPLEIFGSSEAGAIAWRDRRHGDAPWTPLPGVTVSVSPNGLMALDSPFASSDADGADRIRLHPDGRFHFAGRADRTVKVEGKRIDLETLERALGDDEHVAGAAVFVLPGEMPTVAAVVRLSEHGKDALRTLGKFRLKRLLRRRLAIVEDDAVLPRRWRFVDALPVNPMGKSSLESLASLFTGGSEAPQRNGPDVVSIEDDGDTLKLHLWLAPDIRWFEGHFPGRPVLPGVVQLDWVLSLAERYLGIVCPPPEKLQVKFRKILAPGATVTLSLRWEGQRRRLHFNYASGEAVHSSGICWLGAG